MTEQKKCAHAACKCVAAEGSSFCRSYCEGARVHYEPGDGCGCGHDGCPLKVGSGGGATS